MHGKEPSLFHGRSSALASEVLPTFQIADELSGFIANPRQGPCGIQRKTAVLWQIQAEDPFLRQH
jgi:hypothetical protein